MKVRKIAALAVGAAMVGATLGYASAAMPEKEFFVKDGEPNVKIVVGANAPSTMDVVSAADIAVALGTLLYTEKEVEAEASAVVVKEDVSFDPDDIPVFDNTYPSSPVAEDTDWTEVEAWWNGSYDAYGDPYFNVNLTASVWDNGDYGPVEFTVPDKITWEFDEPFSKEYDDVEVTFEGGQFVDYTVNIDSIEFEGFGDIDETDIDDFKDFKLKVDGVTATIVFNASVWEKQKWDVVCGPTGEYSYKVSDNQPKYYTYKEDAKVGAVPGDVISIFGKELKIVALENSTIFDTMYDLIVGEALGAEYLKQGETYTFGDYKVTVLDIDVYDDKALYQVDGPEGSELVILDADEGPKSKVLFDGGVMLTLKDTFVGIEGTLIAYTEINTNLEGYKSGDEFIDNWIINFGIKDNKLMNITLTNDEPLEANTIELFDMFKIDYVADIYKNECGGTDCAAMEAWVVIDPIEPEWETTEVEIGGELDDYIVEGVVTEPVKTIEITEITEPITVLDEEVDLNAVDSNLILVGGPVANAITKYLVDQGLSTVDWENSDGEFEYLEDVFGEYDVLIVAGKDRYATREAAKELMQYLAAL